MNNSHYQACRKVNKGMFFTMYRYDFDPKKSLSNLDKGGIDFISIQAIWVDPDFIEIQAKQ